MNKKIVVIIVSCMIASSITGCNYSGYDFVDTNYHFDRAMIKKPDGTIIYGDIECWADSEDGEQITVTMKDGTRYMTNSSNIILIED